MFDKITICDGLTAIIDELDPPEPKPEPEKESPIDPIERPLRSLILRAKEEGKNIRTYYQDMVFTPCALDGLLADGKFRWWNISNWELTNREQNYYPQISYDEPNPEPAPFAVGDVVRHHSSPYDCGVGYIVEIDGNNACVFFVDDMDTEVVSMSELSRCNPSEVIVKIGCLEGTVTYAISDDCFLLAKVYDPQHRACCIDMSMLDTQTRELVESLLKAQEEK